MGEGRPRLVVVVGMHRSGTSVVTRALEVLGVGLGDELLPAQEANQKGFFEDTDLVGLDMEVLGAIGSDWHYAAPIEPSDVDALREQGFVDRALAMLLGKLEGRSCFGLKDPRVARLLPFWKEVFGRCPCEIQYVLTMRHPLSVAESLAERHGLSAERGMMLWLGHVVAGLSHTAGVTRVLVDYDRMMEAPERELGRVARALGLAIDRDELGRFRSEFLDGALRHTIHGLDDLPDGEGCAALVREVYTTLLEVASDRRALDDPDLGDASAAWSARLEALKPALVLADRLYTHALSAEQQRTIGEQQRVTAAQGAHIEGLGRAVAERDRQIAGLGRELADLRGALAQRDHLIAAIYDSTSWKITRPLRFAGTHIKRLRGGRVRGGRAT